MNKDLHSGAAAHRKCLPARVACTSALWVCSPCVCNVHVCVHPFLLCGSGLLSLSSSGSFCHLMSFSLQWALSTPFPHGLATVPSHTNLRTTLTNNVSMFFSLLAYSINTSTCGKNAQKLNKDLKTNKEMSPFSHNLHLPKLPAFLRSLNILHGHHWSAFPTLNLALKWPC